MSRNAVEILIAAGFTASNLTIVTAQPTSAPYGTDLWAAPDLDPAMIETSGNVVLAQACARRLITTRGAQIDDANYGYDLEQWIGADIGPGDVATIQIAIQQELLKDERVLACQAAVKFSEGTEILTATIAIAGAAGPFLFTLTVSQLDATITMAS